MQLIYINVYNKKMFQNQPKIASILTIFFKFITQLSTLKFTSIFNIYYIITFYRIYKFTIFKD